MPLTDAIFPPGVPTQVFNYRAGSGVGQSDPGAGLLKWNTAGQLDATELYIDWLTGDGFDVQLYALANPVTGLIIQDLGFAPRYQVWELTAPAVNMADWLLVPVRLLSGDTVFVVTPQLRLAVTLFSEGIVGPQGPQGPRGPLGPIGTPTPQVVTVCKDCLFWHVEGDPQADRGHCHRRAPQASRDQITTFWPQTQDTDWCAEGAPAVVVTPIPDVDAGTR